MGSRVGARSQGWRRERKNSSVVSAGAAADDSCGTGLPPILGACRGCKTPRVCWDAGEFVSRELHRWSGATVPSGLMGLHKENSAVRRSRTGYGHSRQSGRLLKQRNRRVFSGAAAAAPSSTTAWTPYINHHRLRQSPSAVSDGNLEKYRPAHRLRQAQVCVETAPVRTH